MAIGGAAAAGGVFPESRFRILSGQRKAHAPGQPCHMAGQIQQTARPPAHQPPRFPAPKCQARDTEYLSILMNKYLVNFGICILSFPAGKLLFQFFNITNTVN